MKKTIFLVFALIFNYSMFAQANMSFGIVGGPMAANFWDSPKPSVFLSGLINAPLEKEFTSAYTLGGSFRLGLRKHVFFQAEMTYEQKGFALEGVEFTDFNGNSLGKTIEQHQFNYAVFAPAIGYMTREKLHFEAVLGIFGGYLTDIKRKFSSLPRALPNIPFLENSQIEDFNRFDFGITSRIGMGLDCGKKLTFTANAIGNLGLSKLPMIDRNNIVSFDKDKTLSLGLQFGFFYNL